MGDKSIQGAEIFATGEWNKRTFTEADLDGIVASFAALGLAGKVPLKFGHNDDQPLTDGQPALGWVSRVWRDGGKLLADFTNLPTVVYDAIKQGLYKFVSVELLRNVKADTREIPWVLDAVALLGADQPAVGNLKDLQALTMSRRTVLRFSERVAFRRDFTDNRSKDMSADIEQMRADFAALKADVARREEADKARDKRDRERDEADRRRQVDTHRAAIMAVFERAINAQEILPNVRKDFEEVYPVADDAAVLKITEAQALAFVAKHPNPNRSKSKMSSKAGGTDEPTYAGPDDELTQRAFALARSNGKDPSDHMVFTRAVQEVLRSDKALAERYTFMPDDLARAAK